MLLKKLLTFLLLGLSLGVFAQEKLSPDEAIKIALENNFQVKIARANQDIARNENTKGNAGMLPVVTGSANKNFNAADTYLQFFDTNLPLLERKGVQNNTSNIGVNVNWVVYDGMGMFIARNQLGKLQNLSDEQAKNVTNNLVAQVVSAYYEVIRQEKRVKNIKKGLEISNDRLKLARDRYEVGQGPKVDLLSAQVDYNEDRATLIAQEQSLENAKINLNTLLIRNVHEDFTPIDTIITKQNLSLEVLREEALKQNPVILQTQLNKNIAELNTKALKSDQMPVISLGTGYNYNTANNGAGAPQSTKSSENFALNLGVRATINIYDGLNLKRRIQTAKINELVVDNQAKDLKNQLLSAIERAYLSYHNSNDLVKLETENYTIARQNIDIAFERYRVGNSTAYELREVQRNAVAAETRLIEAQFNAKIAEIELQRLTGGFSPLLKP